jgi:hypothetical protein
MTWSGPFRILECLHPDYRIEIKGKTKIFHANMLKRYLRREDTAAIAVVEQEENPNSAPTEKKKDPLVP